MTSTGTKQNQRKLTAEHQLIVCQKLAVGYSCEMVSDYFRDIHGIDISRVNIYTTYMKKPRWSQLTTRLRKIYEDKVMEHPLAQKNVRLNFLLDALQEAMAWRLDKIYFDKETGKETARIEKRNLTAVSSLIKEARAEVEGYKPEGMGELKLSLLQIVKDVSGNGDGKLNITTEARVHRAGQTEPTPVDLKGIRDIEILGR